jgi:transcription elongation factor GreA
MFDMKRVCLTQEELIKIKSELDRRIHQKRLEIAARLSAAKELGDLSENAEYVSAKEEQSFNESRIQELEDLVRNADVAEKGINGRICVGSWVKLQSETGMHEFCIVGREGIDLEHNKISYESPLGQALLNKKVGARIEVKAPKGKIKYKILEIK